MEHRRYTKENIKNIAEGVLKIYSDQSYPVKVLEIANNLDLQVFESTFDRDDVSGMLKASEKHILIAQSDNPKRQRFSIAHEIGHYVLHYKGKVFNKDETEKYHTFWYDDEMLCTGSDEYCIDNADYTIAKCHQCGYTWKIYL